MKRLMKRLKKSFITSGMSVSCLLSILERWIHYISIISTARLLCNETINADPTETQRTALCFEIKKLIDDFDKKLVDAHEALSPHRGEKKNLLSPRLLPLFLFFKPAIENIKFSCEHIFIYNNKEILSNIIYNFYIYYILNEKIKIIFLKNQIKYISNFEIYGRLLNGLTNVSLIKEIIKNKKSKLPIILNHYKTRFQSFLLLLKILLTVSERFQISLVRLFCIDNLILFDKKDIFMGDIIESPLRMITEDLFTIIQQRIMDLYKMEGEIQDFFKKSIYGWDMSEQLINPIISEDIHFNTTDTILLNKIKIFTTNHRRLENKVSIYPPQGGCFIKKEYFSPFYYFSKFCEFKYIKGKIKYFSNIYKYIDYRNEENIGQKSAQLLLMLTNDEEMKRLYPNLLSNDNNILDNNKMKRLYETVINISKNIIYLLNMYGNIWINIQWKMKIIDNLMKCWKDELIGYRYTQMKTLLHVSENILKYSNRVSVLLDMLGGIADSPPCKIMELCWNCCEIAGSIDSFALKILIQIAVTRSKNIKFKKQKTNVLLIDSENEELQSITVKLKRLEDFLIKKKPIFIRAVRDFEICQRSIGGYVSRIFNNLGPKKRQKYPNLRILLYNLN
eukprot:GHVL01014467.1.p1 GENE.GHVL01014467.1~~GHVL01014467.1.p1  ORF type:complete len:619 (+),score=182.69 GHVL01014467.1:892-2748(+)